MSSLFRTRSPERETELTRRLAGLASRPDDCARIFPSKVSLDRGGRCGGIKREVPATVGAAAADRRVASMTAFAQVATPLGVVGHSVCAEFVQPRCQDEPMLASTTTLGSAICKAVAAAVRERDSPLSAWPERYPRKWATATRVAELLGRRTAAVSYHLQEQVEQGELISAQPWPAGLRGYQPGSRWRDEASLFALPDPIRDERQWMLDELERWASLHDGRPPRQKDWSRAHDRGREWPRWDRVAELFGAEACKNGLRCFVPARCAVDCACPSGRHYSNSADDEFCDGCFACLGHCPHGDRGEWVGPSGWRYALQVAGLEVLRRS